ncbi:HD-GYP domain-containing protein [Chitinimonas lacunae]|uniref:HD-GYP domain-containing protein n=1 Tax=Chitinimonas lacunae TaxID=1963018 RepID=A0ABV8MN93_9NEIS
MHQRRIRSGEITLGEPLPWNLYNDKGVLLLAEGGRITHAPQLERLLDMGIYIESSVAWHLSPSTALQRCLHACYQLDRLLARPEAIADFPHAIHEVTQLLRQAQHRDPRVVIATVVLRRGGRHSVRQAVNTATVCCAVLAQMGADESLIRATLGAALTMNIGMLELQDSLARQSLPLTPSQRARVERHPIDGAELLQALGVNDQDWLRAVREHHEANDGSGYPNHLAGEAIAPAAQLVGLADLFCARVSERGYRPAHCARLVLRDILIERGRLFDARLAAYFIKALGVYPVGSVVTLKNGDVGVVAAPTDQVDAPLVHALRDGHGIAFARPRPRDTREADLRITGSLPLADLGVPVDMVAIWGSEAADFDLNHLKPHEVDVG